MIYLYISNSNIQGIQFRNNHKIILRNINNINYLDNIDVYIFNIREEQIHLVPKNNKHKIFIFKTSCNMRKVVRKVGACKNLHHKVYFIQK